MVSLNFSHYIAFLYLDKKASLIYHFFMIHKNSSLIELAQGLADPLRLTILQHLIGGAATVSELVAITGEAQSKVSNHLALLRKHGLVRITRQGRHMIYELGDRSVGELIESMMAIAGAVPEGVRKPPPLTKARTCYDHLAGRLGVSIFDSLTRKEAIIKPSRSENTIELGPTGPEVFSQLGIDLETIRHQRRRFAYACLDWTERQPHLGGALGAGLYTRCLEQGWIVKRPGIRIVTVTKSGKSAFRKYFHIEI